ncbi:hypothetical protein [Rhizobium sp. 18065]|uniref:hypothetical protein n=1 Tax=Rhizobium sp. 18065 TaxID=2681411 RepID=UPI00135C225A|nr:hypothetical protein [Rhizobium sp. 18065]
MSANVANLGNVLARANKQKKTDPQERQRAQALASLELMQNQNDPTYAAGKYKGAAPESLDAEVWATAAGRSYFESQQARIIALANERGVQNVDWETEFANIAKQGQADGLIPGGDGAAAFLSQADNWLNTYRQQAATQSANNSAFVREGAAQAGVNSLTNSLKQGPEAGQKALDELFSSETLQGMQPPERQKYLESLIDGYVQGGDPVALNALGNLQGPDGQPLRAKYAANWTRWDKTARDQALIVNEGDVVGEVMSNQGDYEDQVAKIKGSPEAAEYATDLVRKRNAAIALAQETVNKIATAKAAGETVDIDAIKQEAIDTANADGVFSVGGATNPDVQKAFLEVFEPGAQGFRQADQKKVEEDTLTAREAELRTSLGTTFNTVLKQRGPDAAVSEIETVMRDNQSFTNAPLQAQGAMLSALADEYVASGNVKALDALGKVKLNKAGMSIAEFKGVDWEIAKANAEKARLTSIEEGQKPVKERLRTAALTGNFDPSMIDEAQAAGLPSSWVAEQMAKNDSVVAEKYRARDKSLESNAKQRVIPQYVDAAAKRLAEGRGDLIQEVKVPYDPADPEKVVTITKEDLLKRAAQEREEDLMVEYRVKNPAATPEQATRDVRKQVMDMYSRNGMVDDNTKSLMETFLNKVQKDGYSVGPEEEAQLNEVRDAWATYSEPLKDELVGGNGRRRDYIDAIFAGLEADKTPAEAITAARLYRDMPKEQRTTLPTATLDDHVSAVRGQLSDIEEDPVIDRLIADEVERLSQMSTNDDYIRTQAAKNVTDRYVPIFGRTVNVSEFPGKPPRDVAKEVLEYAAEQYSKKYAADLGGEKVIFDNGGKPGTLRLYYKSSGFPVSNSLVNWSDIKSDWDTTVAKPRAEQQAKREAEISAGLAASTRAQTAKDKAREAQGAANADSLMMPERLR